MTEGEFKERVATALRKRGWTIIHSIKGVGTDLTAYVPDGTMACIQCCHEAWVTDYAVMLSVKAKAFYNCPIAVIVTTGKYTDAARSIAYENEVRLMRFVEESGKLEYAQKLDWLVQW